MQNTSKDDGKTERTETGKGDKFLFLGHLLPEIPPVHIFVDTVNYHGMFDDGEYKSDGLENESGRHGNPFRRGEVPAPKSIFRLQTKSSPAGWTVDVLPED